MVEKLDYTNSPLDDKYLNIPKEEIVAIHKEIEKVSKELERYGVQPTCNKKEKAEIQQPSLFGNCFPEDEDQKIGEYPAKDLQLIFLYKYKRKCVHKDLISAFVRKYKPNAALDQQTRHLGTQLHWNILKKGDKIPDENEKVPSGYYYLVTLGQPNPNVHIEEKKRISRLDAKTFDDIKETYGHKCATCGRKEGEYDERNGGIQIKLQQGHMNPSEELTINNTIPQCQYCNQTYGNKFIFDKNGRVKAIYDPEVVLKSPVFVQEEMLRLLQEEREKRGNQLFY